MNSITVDLALYGAAEITPSDPAVAGSYGTWTLVYRVGQLGVDEGGRFKVAFRMVSDWGTPQINCPTGDNYCTVYTTGNARFQATYEPEGYVRPFLKALTFSVRGGALRPGDKVVITLGDRSGGSRGQFVQTWTENAFEIKLVVDVFQSSVFQEVPGPLRLKIVCGPPARLRALAPSVVGVGAPFDLTVKAEDAWGNVCTDYSGSVTWTSPPSGALLPPPYQFAAADDGAHRFKGIILTERGVHRIQIEDRDLGLSAVTNPIEARPEHAGERLLWGDIHGQTGETAGTGTVEEYLRFARDKAALDFTAHQAHDWQMDEEYWQQIRSEIHRFHQPQEFVTFLGYEWSGNTPAGGDHNVYFLDDDGPLHRCSHWQVADGSHTGTDRTTITDLYSSLQGGRALVVPHVGGRRANLAYHHPGLEPVVEICSGHGRFEWFAMEALSRGYKIGFVGNSDDCTGRPGANYPTRGSYGTRNGLTAVWAGENTRQAIWEAIFARRCYATTGERILLSVTADGMPMGSEMTVERAPELAVRVHGTQPLTEVLIRRGHQEIYRYPLVPSDRPHPTQIRLTWGGARSRGRAKSCDWSGALLVERGTVKFVKGIGFQAPGEGIWSATDRCLRWASRTVGDQEGCILDVEGSPDTVLTFLSDPLTFTVTLADLDQGTQRFEAGGLGLFSEIGRQPLEAAPTDVAFTFRDPDMRVGMNAYWIRVTQEDGEMAWSSPIFMNHAR